MEEDQDSRPSPFVTLSENGLREVGISAVIGVDLGGTKLLAVRVAGEEVVAERRSSNPLAPGMLAPAVTEAVQSLLTPEVRAVGVGIAGLVQWPEGVFVWGPHIVDSDVRLREHLEDELGLPCVVDNDANVSAFAEHRSGAGRGYDDLLLVNLGTGIGGAVVIGGEVYRGTSFAGEWGHIMFERNGARCACGKRGCWETVASGPALVRLAREFIDANPQGKLAHRLGEGRFTGEAVTRAADEGDETARGLVAQVGGDLGLGLCNLITAFDPQIVVVGGGLGSVGEALLGPARRTAADALHGRTHRTLPPIVVAALGTSSGAVGAAMLAAELHAGRLALDTVA